MSKFNKNMLRYSYKNVVEYHVSKGYIIFSVILCSSHHVQVLHFFMQYEQENKLVCSCRFLKEKNG